VTSSERSLKAQTAAHISWSRTPDRTKRTQAAREKGPGGWDYWLSKLDPMLFADASEAQKLAAAQSLRKAFFSKLAQQSVTARRKKKGK